MESKFIYKEGNYKLIHSKNNLQDNSFAESGQLGTEIDEKLKKLEIVISGTKHPLVILSKITKVVLTLLLVIAGLWLFSIIKNIRQTSNAKTMLTESNFDDIRLFNGRDYFVCQEQEDELASITCQYFEKKEVKVDEQVGAGLLQEEDKTEDAQEDQETEEPKENEDDDLLENEHDSIPVSPDMPASQKLEEPVNDPMDKQLAKYQEEVNNLMDEDNKRETRDQDEIEFINEIEDDEADMAPPRQAQNYGRQRARQSRNRNNSYTRRNSRRSNQNSFMDSEEDNYNYRPRRTRRMNNSMGGRMLQETDAEAQTEEEMPLTEQSEIDTEAKEESTQTEQPEAKKENQFANTLFVLGQRIFTLNERVDNNNEGLLRIGFIALMSFFIGLRLVYWILNNCIERRITQLLEHFIYLENKSGSPVKIKMNDHYNLVELTLGNFSEIMEDVSFETKENQPGNKLNEIKNFNNKRVEETAEETNNKLKAYFNTNDESLGISISSDKNLIEEEKLN